MNVFVFVQKITEEFNKVVHTGFSTGLEREGKKGEVDSMGLINFILNRVIPRAFLFTSNTFEMTCQPACFITILYNLFTRRTFLCVCVCGPAIDLSCCIQATGIFKKFS